MIEMTYLLGFCHALDNQFESAPNVDSISFGPCIAPLETIERNASLKWNEWRHLCVCACTGNALNMSEWCSQTVKVNVIKRALSVHAERQVAWINRGSFIHFYHDKNMCDTYSLNTVNLHSHTHMHTHWRALSETESSNKKITSSEAIRCIAQWWYIGYNGNAIIMLVSI